LLGYWIFAAKQFEQGKFLLDYHGQLLEPAEADELPNEDYIHYFSIGGKQFRCVFITLAAEHSALSHLY